MKTKVHYNKPVCLGMYILDISKSVMYGFHYHYIKEKYKDEAKLLFTNTDSLMYHIETEDVYNDFAGDISVCYSLRKHIPKLRIVIT